MVCREFGPPSSLKLEILPSRPLEMGEARLAVKAAGVNFADSLMVAGTYQVKPPMPVIPGLEAAGIITEVSQGVTGLKPGDRVLSLTAWGAYADELVWSADRFLKIPDAMDFVSAAAFSLTFGTAHMALARRARLKAGETLVVMGAGGGVGSAAVAVGKALGARVIAVAGGVARGDVARAAGADEVIDHQTQDVRAAVRALTGDTGAHVIFDPVGGDAFKTALKVAAWEGRIVVVGFASGHVPQIPANHLLVKNVDVVGFFWGAYKTHDLVALKESLSVLFRWWEAGRVKPHIDRTYPLDQAGIALQCLLDRQAAGKIVLIP
jgi:NADPH2:quinone reductase